MSTLLTALGVLALYMTFLFIISLLVKNNGIADVGYGIAFMVLIGTTEFLLPVSQWQLSLLTSLPFIWAIRLALRIGAKNYGKAEDFRYKMWRDAWGKSFIVRSFLQIYMLQGLVIFLVALPVTLSVVFREPVYTPLVISGCLVWLLGFVFEVVGDRQLDSFVKNPENKGKIMMWWGLAIAAIGMTPFYWTGFISPLLITFLLLKVSGVPLLEKKWEGNPEWEAYKKRTSVFLPMIPQK
jgi:steroid 5-alpha reductase family enzyme